MRRISENGFGILANKWRVFCRPFSLEPEKVKIVTLAAITLHNWLRSESKIGKIDIVKIPIVKILKLVNFLKGHGDLTNIRGLGI